MKCWIKPVCFLWKIRVKSSQVRRNIFSHMEILRFTMNTSKKYHEPLPIIHHITRRYFDSQEQVKKYRHFYQHYNTMWKYFNFKNKTEKYHHQILYGCERIAIYCSNPSHCRHLRRVSCCIMPYNHDVDIETSRMNLNMHVFLLLCCNSLLQEITARERLVSI